jgi:hypothetical protein
MRWGVESRNAQPLGPAGDYAAGGAGAASLPEEKGLGGCVWHVRLCLCLAVRA